MSDKADDTEEAFVPSGTFKSFFMGGFECSSHRKRGRSRLDLLAATGHDRAALNDYKQLSSLGIKMFRDGLRWHRVEKSPGRYDWSSFLPMLRAAKTADVQVTWDLLHYGWPDDIDIFQPIFIERFRRFASAVAKVLREEVDSVPFFCPVNEISYFAWAGGAKRMMNPFRTSKAHELKQQLVRASIAAIEAVREVDRRARIVQAEPAIHVASSTKRYFQAAKEYTASQFEALDMICGLRDPGLGGTPDYLDLVGVNYYPDNQWFFQGGIIPMGHHCYRPLRELLKEVAVRYKRPVFIAETGAEGTARPSWFHYVSGEVLSLMEAGTHIEGICLYPITDYPGWEDGRLCETGLLGPLDAAGSRKVFKPLLDQIVCTSGRLRMLTDYCGDAQVAPKARATPAM
jgi:hypothetical protein